MNLEMFQYVDEIIEVYESKRDIYKLIADEIQGYFEKHVFDKSKYTFNIIYRLKTVESIKEKLLRNSYISQYRSGEKVLANFSDLIGLRIECKFIDDEPYVYNLLLDVFTQTSDGVYYSAPGMPQIKLNLQAPQPQKQKNGFDIYKIDGRYELGGDSVRFELQIKALVNSFWGEVEHKIIYKNNSYLLGDGLIIDLMTSIKKSLTMIDSQLYVLYKRFRREEDVSKTDNNMFAIERFISKTVYDVFAEIMQEQLGFAIDFKESCDTVVHYIIDRNGASDLDGCGRVMLNIIETLNNIKTDDTRLDNQIEIDGLVYGDHFSKTMLSTIKSLINVNYKWHIYFLLLQKLERTTPEKSVDEFISTFRTMVLQTPSLNALADEDSYETIAIDLLDSIADTIAKEQQIELLGMSFAAHYSDALNEICPMIADRLGSGEAWQSMREDILEKYKEKISFYHFSR